MVQNAYGCCTHSLTYYSGHIYFRYSFNYLKSLSNYKYIEELITNLLKNYGGSSDKTNEIKF